jgi:hypothetical protein
MFLYNGLMMTYTQGQNYLPDNDRKGVLCENENTDRHLSVAPTGMFNEFHPKTGHKGPEGRVEV